MRKIFAVMASMAVIVGVGAGSAFAGEVKGPPGGGGGETAAPGHAKSLCAFSGLNDYDPNVGQNDRQTQTPKDAAPGSPAKGWTITIPGVGEVTIACNPNGPVG